MRLDRMPHLLLVLLLSLLSSVKSPAQPNESPERHALAAYTGIYQWSDGHFLSVQFWPELGPDQLCFFDETGPIRALFASGNDTFTLGPGLAVPKPVESEISFERDGTGAVRSLVSRREGAPPRSALRASGFSVAPVSFRNGSTVLSGSLFLPAGPGPYAAVVLTQGSGAQDRYDALPFAWFLVCHGIAVLSYDKRGAGGSTGDWQQSSFIDLADDALAAVHLLQKDRRIVSAKIGIMGASQGGWIAPLAASRSRDVAFVVSVSGPAVTPAEETLDFMRNEMKINGFSQGDVDQAATLANAAFRYARTGQGWNEYLALRKAATQTEWFPYMGLSDSVNDPQWTFKRLTFDYDPLPVLASVHCPVLAFFGGHDLNVVAEKNRALWKQSLDKASNHDYLLSVIPAGNHVLLDAETGSIVEFPKLQRFDPQYEAELLQWMTQHLPGVIK